MLQQLQFNLGDTPAAPTGAAPRPPQSAPPNGPELKRQRNRARITGEGNPRPYGGGSETVPIHRYGLQDAAWDQYDFDTHEDLIHDTFNWRRNAQTKFVNLVGTDAVRMVQDTVDPNRVKQIAADPGTGSDPRFPGRELPKVLQRSSGAQEVINGTHRISAAVGYEGRLFTEARVLPEEKWEEPPSLMKQARNIRENVAYKRYVTKNPEANL